MDIALEAMNSGPRGRFSNNNNPKYSNNNARPPSQFDNPNQFNSNNPRFNANTPNTSYNPPNNYQSTNHQPRPFKQNYRDEERIQPNYQPNNRQSPQEDYQPMQRQNPRFPPPPPRDHRSQPRQNQFDERQDYRQQPQFSQQKDNFDHEGRFGQRPNPRNDPNYNQNNPRFRGNQPTYDRNNQPDYQRNKQPDYQRNNQRNERSYPQQRNYQQTDRGLQGRNDVRPYQGRGRGRERGRGRGRGREVSRIIQENTQHSQPNQRHQNQQRPPSKKQSDDESKNESISEESQQESESGLSQQNASQGSDVAQIEEEGSGSIESSAQLEEEGSPQDEVSAQSASNQPTRLAAHKNSESNESLSMQQIHTMCSKDEFNERLDTFNTNNRNQEGAMMRLDTGRSFAIFEINKKTGEPDYALALKRYRRSTNRSQDDQEKDEQSDLPRSRNGLMMAIKHIHKEIIDADNVKERDLAFPLPPGEAKIEFLHIFDFLWNRMREMIKDVSRLPMRERSAAQIITMCEQMLRFFIIAIREGKLPHSCRLQFDPKLNLESITKILTQLLEIYEEAHMKLHKQASASVFISPNEPQIIGYAIIISNDIQKTLNEKLMIKLNGEGLEHPLLASRQIQKALRIKKALKNKDYETFYQILEDDDTDYVMSCLLIHHLPIIRRETMRILYSSSQPEPNSKHKKIPEQAFRHALRFKDNQRHQFKEFLQDIRATVINQNGESFILLSQHQDHLQESHIASTYSFQRNKLQRSNYQMKPASKRLINQNLMSRQDLAKKSWFVGDYDRLVRRYYDPYGSQANESQQQSNPEYHQDANKRQDTIAGKIPPKEDLQLPEKMAPSSPTPQPEQKKMNFLLLKKKEFERNKFLKTLQGLVQNLIKNSDIHSQHQRKKGLQTILELTDLSRMLALQAAFNRISQYALSKKIAEETIKKLQQYFQIRKYFQSTFNRRTFEYPSGQARRFDSKMSSLLKSKRQGGDQGIMKQLLQTYKCSKMQGRRRVRILYIFTSDHRKPLSDSQRLFLANFYSYLTLGIIGKQQAQSQISKIVQIVSQCSLEFQRVMLAEGEAGIVMPQISEQVVLDYSFTFFHYRTQNGEVPFMSGYDGVAFVDFWKNISTFQSLVRDLHQGKRAILKGSHLQNTPLYQSYLVLHLGSGESNWQVSSISEYSKAEQSFRKDFEWQSSWQRLQNESNHLTAFFRMTITNFMASQLKKAEKVLPEVGLYSLSSLLDQIQSNLECITTDEVKKDLNSLQFLEIYFNQSLQCLKRSLLELVTVYDIFDWRKALEQANYSKQDYPEQRINLNVELHKKIKISLQVISSLKLSISSSYASYMKKQPQGSGLYVLSQLAEAYLQSLSKEEQEDYLSCLIAYVLQANCHLTLEHTVSGDCKGLFHFLLSKVKQKLAIFQLILPKGFEFKIPKNSLVAPQNIQQTSLAKSTLSKRTERSKNDLMYSRSAMLSQLLFQIQEEDKEQEKESSKRLRKAIKTK